MSCLEWQEAIALHAGGDLRGTQAAGVERHLEQCAACRSLATRVREMLDALGDLPPVTEAHCAAVRARVLSQIAKRRRPWWAIGLAAALATILITAVAVRERRQSPPLPRVTLQLPTPPALPAPVRAKPGATVMVRLMTDDPDIVLYWIAENKGE